MTSEQHNIAATCFVLDSLLLKFVVALPPPHPLIPAPATEPLKILITHKNLQTAAALANMHSEVYRKAGGLQERELKMLS
jgi:hypothetical protein